MRDQIETLHFRIDNALQERSAQVRKVSTPIGRIGVQELSGEDITFGKFATSKRELQYRNIVAYFIESSSYGTDDYPIRQLWLPVPDKEASRASVREIIATGRLGKENKFSVWQREAEPWIHDLRSYSPFDTLNSRLFEEAKLLLTLMGANDGSLPAALLDRGDTAEGINTHEISALGELRRFRHHYLEGNEPYQL